MATYKSDKVNLAYPAETVFSKLSNLEGLRDMLQNAPVDQLPDEQKQMLDQVRISGDTISFPAGPVGEISLQVVERRSPDYVRLEGMGTPVPMSLALNVIPTSADTCEAFVEIDVQIPAMLKPMVNKPLQQMADQFGTMLRQLRY